MNWLRVLAVSSLLVGCSRAPSASPSSSPTGSAVADLSTASGTAAAGAAAPAAAVPATASATASAAAPAEPPPPSVVSAVNAFGLRLFGQSKSADGPNLTISPTSVAIALAMTCGGARGQTAAEMKKVLGYDCADAAAMKASGAMAANLERTPGVTLAIANRLFGDKAYPFKPRYLDATKSTFGASLEPLDFRTAGEASRTRINGWVEEKTQKRIKDLLPAGSITPASRLVLVNALYFLGDWSQPFDKSRTRAAPFTLESGSRVDVPTMRHAHHFAYAETDGASLVELPYAQNGASMVLVVPKDAATFRTIEAALDGAWIDRAFAKLATGDLVALSMPKFTLEPRNALKLAGPLAAMGMKTLFGGEADLGDIAEPPDPRERLRVSEVFHKTFVRVDEKGTEAAAATAVSAKGGGGPPKTHAIDVDRPFFFAIRNRASGALLFWGRVADPRGAS